ncbi:hypothetical protein ACIBM4_22895 [Streptomyces sp. NPDC050256]|uniref:hypothetical protein n=1 Tax=unclassified Streptomyces TaxID=2593676 RepID=UPI0037AAADBE
MSERRRATGRPEADRNSARTVIAASVLAGVSAVIVSFITGLGSSIQGLVTDVLTDEKKPAASAPPHAEPAVPLKVVAIPEEGGTFLVSEQRVTSPEDRAVLINGATTQEEWERLLRKIKATSIHKTAYKVAVTNVSSSTVRVVDIVPVITRRTAAIDTTMIEPLGGTESDSIPVQLNLDNRYPKFTQNGKPYFTRQSQVLKAGEGFVMAVEAKLLGREYAEYHLKVNYLDKKGNPRSLEVNEPGTGVGVFRVSGTVDDKEYADYWGAEKDGRGRRLYSREERK